MYGTYIYYDLKITDNWIIESNIGTLSILLIIDDNLVLTFTSPFFFFIAFTQEQFDYVLSHVVLFSIYIGLASLALTIVDSIVNSIYFTKGTYNKITTMIVTIFYLKAICWIFAISLVSIPNSFKRAFVVTVIQCDDTTCYTHIICKMNVRRYHIPLCINRTTRLYLLT